MLRQRIDAVVRVLVHARLRPPMDRNRNTVSPPEQVSKCAQIGTRAATDLKGFVTWTKMTSDPTEQRWIEAGRFRVPLLVGIALTLQKDIPLVGHESLLNPLRAVPPGSRSAISPSLRSRMTRNAEPSASP
jgi:hypothetical protein